MNKTTYLVTKQIKFYNAMKTRNLFILCVAIFCLCYCKKESDNKQSDLIDNATVLRKSLDSFSIVIPTSWNCDIHIDSLKSLPIPEFVEIPLAVIKYYNTKDSFVYYNKKANPSLYLQLYDLSKKDTIEKIINSTLHLSSCVPKFYGENSKYYVITSPCYINNGCFTEEADSLINPLHKALKVIFTRSGIETKK